MVEVSPVVGVELVVGYLVAWAVRKARRVAGRADAEVDAALDAGMDRLHDVVAAKLGGDPALAKLAANADVGVDSPRTRERVRLAVQDAVEEDPEFGERLAEALAAVQQAEASVGAKVTGDHGVAVGGDVAIHAEHGSAAAWEMSNVSFGQPPDPSQPGRDSH